MKRLTQEQFTHLIESTSLKPRQTRDLKFLASTSHMSAEDWSNSEVLAIKDRTKQKGVLIVTIESGTYVLPYELTKLAPSSSTGRASSIICDLCMTWQSGTRAGSVVFPGVRTASTSVGYLCCADLECSRHVRTLTSASKISRTQVRENMNDESRIDRLHVRLKSIITSLQARPVSNDHS